MIEDKTCAVCGKEFRGLQRRLVCSLKCAGKNGGD